MRRAARNILLLRHRPTTRFRAQILSILVAFSSMNYRTKKTVVRHGVDQSRNAVPKLTSSTIHQMESSSQLEHPESLGNLMEGAAWMTTFKIVDRCTAVLSTSILARLLVQEDFGFVALATSMIAVLQVFGAFAGQPCSVSRLL